MVWASIISLSKFVEEVAVPSLLGTWRLHLNQVRARIVQSVVFVLFNPLRVLGVFQPISPRLARRCVDRATNLDSLHTPLCRPEHDADHASGQGGNQLRHERGQHHVPGLHFQGGKNRNTAGGGSTCGESFSSRVGRAAWQYTLCGCWLEAEGLVQQTMK